MSQTHWKKLTNPNYLGSWDFAPGEERLLTISKVTTEEVFNPSDNSKKSCTIAYFRQNSKPMVLNKTNCKTIQKLSGSPYIENWGNLDIIVRVEKVKAFGKLEEGLRIVDKKPTPVTQLLCADCGNEIVDSSGYAAGQIAKSTLRTYGAQLCMDCGNKRKAEGDVVDNDINP